jgi:hypothetical protein
VENFDDVEFGVDKKNEEAPILVAQRYLNIFRQIHIFNKAKRDQFDDELLALPTNIVDFFKRMPGGRLLVEHMEDVKTERGISFVKSNKADFSNGESEIENKKEMTAQPSSGGNLVIDASFATSLANAMAQAIKQFPQNTAATPLLTKNFESTLTSFIDELKASRTSILELLKETQSMTNAVLSSQAVLIQLLTRENTHVPIPSQPSNFQESISTIQKNLNTQDLQSPSTRTKDTTEQLQEVPFDTFDDDTTDSFVTNTDDVSYLSSSPSLSDDEQIPQRKKKKKKKKKNLQNSFDSGVSVQNQLSSNKNPLVSSDNSVVDNDVIDQNIFQDDFNDISQDLSSSDIEVPSDSSDNFVSSTTFSDKDDDFVDLDNFSTDDLDFSLPDETANNTTNSSITDGPNNSYSESTENDSNYSSTSIDASQTNSASKDQDEIDFSSLDSLISNPEDFPSSMGNSNRDGVVFSNNNASNESETSFSLNDLTDSSVLPEIDNEDEQENIPHSSAALSESTNISDFSSLDDLLGNDISKPSSSEINTTLKSTPTEIKQPTPSVSRYQAELDKIRDALTSDNVDISSLDSPIALDDYSDDENIHEDDTVTQSSTASSSPSTKSDDDWEWEYVEDDGSSQDSDDWEWEYVEDDGSDTNIDNKQQ